MAYTKQIAKHDKITIDGTDVSNAFRTFGFTGEHSEEQVGGFSVSGQQETLAGQTTTGFTGEAYYTEELIAIVGPIFFNRSTVEITWQPDGLVDATREVYVGDCQVFQFGPTNTFGSVSVMPFTARAATEAGITISDYT
jgi:hypothetical protein